MSEHQRHSGYAPLSIVEAYWQALRGAREMPKRAEIDPRGIESALEFAFILERVAPGVARMRIAGSHLHDILGMEARGMPLTSLFAQDDRTRVAQLLEEVFQTPASAQIMMRSPAGADQPALDARMILLPLKSDLGDVSRILGCLVSPGEIGQTPRRFDLSDAVVRPLVGAPRPAEKHERELQGFAERHAPFLQKTRTGMPHETLPGQVKRPGHLRLVVSND